MHLIYYILLGLIVAANFLIILRYKGFNLMGWAFVTTVIITILGSSLSHLLLVPSGISFVNVLVVRLIDFGLFPLISVPILLGISLVVATDWFVINLFNSPSKQITNQTREPVPTSSLRYCVLLVGILALIALHTWTTYSALKPLGAKPPIDMH